jgi:glycosyltransferase involved in cell wall biosynthesis
MADVWIGKYAKENDIDIICVKHEHGFVKQQEFEDSIYTNDLKNDKLQTILVNESYDKKELSIIIPTFNIPNYLVECLDSIINSIGDFNCEILVGIDNCENTLNTIKNQKFDERINFYYFDENVGPYIIKNSLSVITKSDYILFFDSDDIMLDQLIIDVMDRKKDCDIIKPMYLDFNDDVKNVNKSLTYTNTFGEGVFGVKKRLFLYFNGFEGWRCAADSDFMNRLYQNNAIMTKTNNIGFYRRVHSTSLTQDNSTSYSSILRSEYSKISNAKTYFGPLSELSIKPFTKVNISGESSPNIMINKQKIDKTTNTKKLEMLKKIPYIKSKTQEGGNINNNNIIIIKTLSTTNSKLFNKKRR